ncbi:MAG TPA: hypothetical protein VGH44_00350 [Candidatus Saccharimonadia bacterium]|jgi:hypothetical protein
MATSEHSLRTGPGSHAEGVPRRTFWEASRLWLRDANKFHLLGLFRVVLLVFAGYAPFAALNDALAPFTFGLPFLDDLEIPIGLIAALKIFHDIQRYRDPTYRPRRWR